MAPLDSVATTAATNPSKRFFYPHGQGLRPYRPDQTSAVAELRAEHIRSRMNTLIAGRHYPCVAAVQSFLTGEYRVGVYEGFGTATSSFDLSQDLLTFLAEQKRSRSSFLSFWAVFTDNESSDDGYGAGTSEDQFEKQLWQQLSDIARFEKPDTPWDPHFSSNPVDKNFCFSFGGSAFFVVGLFPGSSRLARRFPYPTLIFNVYDQFRDLQEQGKYQPMVEVNRKRDLKYQGDINPMVEAHGETWEAIQFSGKKNSSSWKCPFHSFIKSHKNKDL